VLGREPINPAWLANVPTHPGENKRNNTQAD
jgi:hypothetical protein